MRPAALFAIVALALGGCPGGGAGLGETCSRTGDCSGEYQCISSVCVQRCQHAPECGDGFACTLDGLCIAATGQTGDACTSEIDCAAGLACQLDGGSDVDANGLLLATCSAATGVRPAEAACERDVDCRNGTCALGRCVDLCNAADGAPDVEAARACVTTDTCTKIPRVGLPGAHAPLFGGCLPQHGVITWAIPVDGPRSTLELPRPDNAQSLALVMSVDDVQQEVGAISVFGPDDADLFELTAVDPFATLVRHEPELGQSVLAMPSSPDPGAELVTGAYHVTVASLRPPFGGLPTIGSATPRVTAVAKLGSGSTLDLHFYFLDFTDHPCAAAFAGETLTATTASVDSFFQQDYLHTLRTVLANAGISILQPTYEDLANHPDLDGLDVADASALLQLGVHATGINVFFVRSLSPVGLQAFAPNPGPPGLGGTRQSGIVIGLDTLCYRSWTDLARLTARELARYMGLYDTVGLTQPTSTDPISDTTTDATNLMFPSEHQGTDISTKQRDILRRSGVLRE